MRTLKKLAAAMFILALTASSAFAIVYGQAGYETYGYDESNAWEIDSETVLKTVRNDLNNGRIDTLATRYYRLTKDLDITRETSWTPIGSESKPFNGVFDGGGHTIKVLMSTSGSKYAGLFGYVEGGTVKNLSVKGKVLGSNYDSWNDTYHYAGGIAAYVKIGTIDNCKFDGEVKSSAQHRWSSDYSYAYAGGITGRNGGAVTIINCTVGGDDSSTTITAQRSGTYSDSGMTYASGIIGYFYDQNYRDAISYNYSRVTLEADETRNRIYGYRDGTSGSVAGNTEIDPEAENGTPPAISRTALPDAYNGETYSTVLSATGTSPITWSIYSGYLPSGLSLNSLTGAISGTLLSTGTYTFVIMASNVSGSDTASFTIKVNERAIAPTISSSSYLGSFTTGDSLSIWLYANGTEPITWSVSGGTLPSGLSLSSSGLLSGTVTASGSFSFTVKATNTAGNDTKTFSLDVANPYVEIDTVSLPEATVGEYYDVWLYASGYNLPYYDDWEWTYEIPSSLYMQDITFDSDGEIFGTPSSAGTYTFTATARNGSYSASKTFTLTVNSAPVIPPTITTSALPVAVVGSSYSFWLAAESDGDVTWTVTGLPSGLYATSGGWIYGTPNSGSYSSLVTVSATNEGGTTSRTFYLGVTEPSGIAINATNFPDDNFRSYISNNFDSDSDGWLSESEIASVTRIYVYGLGIYSVEGISYFTELTSLTVWNNYLTWIDVSGNEKLTYLDCDNNQLEEIDISNNPLLRSFYCQNNKLTYLDVSANTLLRTLYCGGNMIRTLDLSNNPSITSAGLSSQSVDGLSVFKEAGNDYYSVYLGEVLDDFENVNSDTIKSDTETAFEFDSSEGIAKFYSLPEYVSYEYYTDFPGNDDLDELYMTVEVYPYDEPSVVTEALPSATSGSYYSANVEAISKTGVTWELSWGSLPSGLTLASDGTISGTPSYSSTWTFGLRAYNDYGSATGTYSITVNAPAVEVYPPNITRSYLSSGSVGSYYYASMTATGTTPITWTATGLPSGLVMYSWGSIAGTPTESGTFLVTVTASNSAGSSSMTYSLEISGTAPTISTSSLSSGRINEAYSATLYASGAGVTWQISSGYLPNGLWFDESTGEISGTPIQEGTFTFTVAASNAYGSDSRTYTLEIDGIPPTITTTAITSGRVNEAYSFTFTATGSGTITWSISEAPAGLTLSSGGVLSGTPTTQGTYHFTVTAENGEGSVSRSFTLIIEAPAIIPPSITTISLPPATVDTAYSKTLEATGTAPITWTASGLPAGITMSEAGVLSGTPTEAGKFSVIVTATNALGSESAATKTFELTVNGVVPEITTSASEVTAGTVGKNYSVTFSAKGTAPIAWTASGLPAGVTMSEAGVLSGTPTEAGAFSITVTATNIAGGVNKTFALTINAEAPKIQTSSIPSGTINTAYSQTMTAQGTAPITWNCIGNLPEGLTLSSAGTISGTPKQSGSFDITLKAENSAGSDSKKYTMFIEGTPPTINIIGSQYGIVGKEYSALIETSGTRPITLAISGGNLPAGLALNNSNSTITGTFTTQGMYTFEVEASNIAGSVKQSFTIAVHEPVKPKITTKSLPDAYNNEEYTCQLEAEGSPELEWVHVDGNLPGGLELSDTGEISGTVNTSKTGKFSFKVKVKNSEGESEVKTLSIKVVGKEIGFKTEALKAAKWGSKYSATIQLKNFKATSWNVVGDLPEGITLNQKGKLSGTPLEIGEFEFTVVASNGAVELVQDFELVVKGIPPKLTGSFKKGTEGVAYSYTFKAKGTTPIEWEFDELPDGLDYTPDATGETCTVAGTPQGAFSDTVKVTITNGANDEDSLTKNLKLTIKAVTPKFATKSGTIPSGTVGEDYSFQFELSAKPVATEWSLDGNVPEGLRIDSDSGLLQGVPEESGTFSFKVTAQNASKSSLKKSLSVKITIAPARSDKPADDVSVQEDETLTNEVKPEFVDGVIYYERGELSAETLARVANNGEIIVAVLPAVEVETADLYEFTVELDPSAREGATLVWHSFPNGEEAENDEAFFLDDENEVIETVPESYSVTVSAWLEPGVVYEPVIAVKISD